MFYESKVINVKTPKFCCFVCLKQSVKISAYTNQSRVLQSVRMRENGAEVYPKQSSLEWSF